MAVYFQKQTDLPARLALASSLLEHGTQGLATEGDLV